MKDSEIVIKGTGELKEALEKTWEELNTEEFRSLLDDFVHISGIKDFLKSFNLIWNIGKIVAVQVDKISNEYHLCSEDERIEVAAELLDQAIKLPNLVEPFDKTIFTVVIKAVYNAFKDKYGSESNWKVWEI